MPEPKPYKRIVRKSAMLGSLLVVALFLCGVTPPIGVAEAKGQCRPAKVAHKTRRKARHPARKHKRKRSYGLSGKLNLNTATSIELQLLPGIGPRRARRIIAWRARRQFKHIWQLRRVRGFGRKTLRRLSPYLTIKGKTTLKRKRVKR